MDGSFGDGPRDRERMGPDARARAWRPGARRGFGREAVRIRSRQQSWTTQSFFALTLEAPFAIRAAPRVFVLLAPTLDLGLAGSESSPGGTGLHTKVAEFGFEGGLMALF